eukprot:CAMPEP_0172303984 /NCGR_PEP_ID=MMETSP1058-20130122/5444_1 /TAXON_ID=83371 /ORGANISM="Detonula confervacea, Strain CCMP 353" /LENGTH=562 /DNA_ID=CAMNT_0013015023 /DNA_START=44 /DNA_END=1732 /DNA_ORIENTATION=-
MAEDTETAFASGRATSSYSGPISVDHYVEEDKGGEVAKSGTTKAKPFNEFLDFLSTPTQHEGLQRWVQDGNGPPSPPQVNASGKNAPVEQDCDDSSSIFQADGDALDDGSDEEFGHTDANQHEESGRSWAVEDGNSPPRPPEGLFHVKSPVKQECDDSSSIFEADGDGLYYGGDDEFDHPDATTTGDAGFFESCTSTLDKVLHPTFNSYGNFVGYEARGNQEIQNDLSQRNKPNKKYATMLTLLFFFVAIVSVVYLSGGTKRSSSISSDEPVGHEILDYSQITTTTANDTPSKQHTHPQKEHALRHTESPTEKPTNDAPTSKQHHTHPQKEHALRNSERPTKEPTNMPLEHHIHTHPQKDHAPRHSESPTISPSTHHAYTSLADYEADYASDSELRNMPLIAVAAIKKSHPDDEWGGLEELAVERDERISFVRFDLSSIAKDDVVVRAKLNLYLKKHSGQDGELNVEKLPHGGNWTDQSVSWNNPPNSTESYSVNSFNVTGLPSGVTKQLIEVDVTSAILYQNTQEWVTFKLSAASSGDLWFASKRWNGGEAAPELVVTLAA